MLKTILAAILYLAPHLDPSYAMHYARLIHKESKQHRIDPLLVTTIIHVETAKSWRMSVRSPTHDFGLMQIHVSRNSNKHLLGMEEVLFHPGTNIHYGLNTLVMWRGYHQKTCNDSDHPFWSHYQWGYRVRNLMWTKKVAGLYNHLIGVFRSHPLQAELQSTLARMED